MTDAEKQVFIDSLKDSSVQYFDQLPLEIQKIANPAIFEATTLTYLNNLAQVIPNATLNTDVFSTFGNYL